MTAGAAWDADRIEALVGGIYRSAAVGRVGELAGALATWKPSDGARDTAVAGGAWLVLFKFTHDVDHLSCSLEYLRAAWKAEPTPSRASNLASALLEWAWLPQRADIAETLQAHREAVQLLEQAVSETDDSDPVWVTRATTLLGAYADEVEARMPGYDVEKALDFGEVVVARAEQLGVGRGEPANLLGGALIVAADLGHKRGDLDRAVTLLRQAVDALAPDHPDRPARLSNLGSALMDRYERRGAPEDRVEAIQRHREAFATVAESDLNRPLIANNLLNALCADIEVTGDFELAREAAELTPLLSSAFGPGHPRRAVMLSNAALAQRLVGVLTDDRETLEAAIRGQHEAVELTAPDDPSRAGRLASLSVVLGDRYHRTGDPADLDAALTAAGQAASAPGDVVHETIGFLSNLGNLHHDRFLLTGSIADLDRAGQLHLAGLDALPEAHPITTALQNNAGIALSDRFDRLGDPSDLAAAIGVLEKALAATPADGMLRAGREVNLAVGLARRFAISGDPDDIFRATELAGAAFDRARAAGDRQSSAAALGALIDSLRLRWQQLDDHDALSRLRVLLDQPESDEAPGIASARLLRRAVVRHVVEDDLDRRDLRRAIDLGLEARPGVALAAARQLAADALVARMRGERAASAEAREAVEAGRNALTTLLQHNENPQSELSWRRDAQGMAAVAAQVALLDEDPAAALAAFESGHAVLLTRRLPAVRQTDPANDELAVTAWTTPVGGGAILSAGGTIVAAPALPALRADRVERWVSRLAMSSRLGLASIEPILTTVLIGMAEALQPVSDGLVDRSEIVWIGGGMLSVLPFAALPVGGTPMGERASVRQAATPTFARWSAAHASRHRGVLDAPLSIAAPAPSKHPPLPGAELEAAYFAPPDRRLLGVQATPHDVVTGMTTASLVHFAGHAFTSAPDPLANYLLLARDEPLHAQTVAELELSGRLAVLSACDTAAVGVAHADEGLGLASAFHMAGVPGVIATLWPVRDRGTAGFMAELAGAVTEGLPPTEALRTARATARGQQDLPGSVWAAFVLSGA